MGRQQGSTFNYEPPAITATILCTIIIVSNISVYYNSSSSSAGLCSELK